MEILESWYDIERGSNMSAHALLYLGKRLRAELHKFDNTEARMLDCIYHRILNYLKLHFCKKRQDFCICYATL